MDSRWRFISLEVTDRMLDLPSVVCEVVVRAEAAELIQLKSVVALSVIPNTFVKRSIAVSCSRTLLRIAISCCICSGILMQPAFSISLWKMV